MRSISLSVSKGQKLLLTQCRPNRVGWGICRFGRGAPSAPLTALRLSIVKPRVVERPKALAGRAPFPLSCSDCPNTSWLRALFFALFQECLNIGLQLQGTFLRKSFFVRRFCFRGLHYCYWWWMISAEFAIVYVGLKCRRCSSIK